VGLDMFLHRQTTNKKLRILKKLREQVGYEEVMYWRKSFRIHDWFCNRFPIENCVEVKVSKKDLLDLIEYCKLLLKKEQPQDDYDELNYDLFKEDLKKLKKVIDKTDWDNEEISYYAWW